MRTTSDTRYPKTKRIRIYTICDEELAEYCRIIRPGERIIIENRAANAKCTGVWKVYGDERQARQTFAKYKKCTQVYCERWQSGSGLDKLAVADR